jgi:hypothetical protein
VELSFSLFSVLLFTSSDFSKLFGLFGNFDDNNSGCSQLGKILINRSILDMTYHYVQYCDIQDMTGLDICDFSKIYEILEFRNQKRIIFRKNN